MNLGDSSARPAHPLRPTLTLKPLQGHWARLTIEPLEPGVAQTLGQMLYRALCALQDEGAPGTGRLAVTKVEPARVHQRVDCERLEVDLQTNAAVRAGQAFEQAAHFLMEPLASFAASDSEAHGAADRAAAAAAAQRQAHEQAGLNRSVDDLALSVRASHGLKAQNLVLWGDLVQRGDAELLRLPLLGRKGVQEIKDALAAHGLTLGRRLEGWPSAGDGHAH